MEAWKKNSDARTHAWPFDRTKRSRLAHFESLGLKLRNLLKRTWATGAMPCDVSCCPRGAVGAAHHGGTGVAGVGLLSVGGYGEDGQGRTLATTSAARVRMVLDVSEARVIRGVEGDRLGRLGNTHLTASWSTSVNLTPCSEAMSGVSMDGERGVEVSVLDDFVGRGGTRK